MKLKFKALAASVGAALALASGGASALETTFNGFANGCFAVVPALTCLPTANSSGTQTASLFGLTYQSSNFSGTTAAGFLSIGAQGEKLPLFNVNNLGSFTLTGTPATYAGNHFSLMVTFVDPSGVLPSNHPIFNSTLFGTVVANNTGGVTLDFDNSATPFTFSGGNFNFFLNDVDVNPGRTIGLSGHLQAQVTTVPEPETYALFMAGLAAVGFMSRRRKT